MDQKELSKKIEEAFMRLPPELQAIAGDEKWIAASEEITKRNGLNIPQMGQVQNEIMLVLLGIIHPDKFLWEIKDQLNLPTEKINALTKEISEAVFIPIREQLMTVYTRNTSGEAEKPAEVAAEKNIFGKAGITIENENTSTATPKPSENRKDLLKELENPIKSQPTVLNEIPVPVAPYATDLKTSVKKEPITPASINAAGDITAGKLGGTFSVTKKDTDYSIKNLGGLSSPSTQLGKDSYREPIE